MKVLKREGPQSDDESPMPKKPLKMLLKKAASVSENKSQIYELASNTLEVLYSRMGLLQVGQKLITHYENKATN